MVIVSPEIGEMAINKRHEAIKKSIKDFGGDVFFEEVWGLRDLAYSIKKQDQGFYIVMDVNLDPSTIKEMDRAFRLETEILRHLLIKLPNVYQPKTRTEMDAEVDKLMPEIPKEDRKPKMGGYVRPVPASTMAPKVEEKKVEKAAEPAAKSAPKAEKKEVAEEAPKKTAPKKENKKSLEDIDAKLDSILSNPDINF